MIQAATMKWMHLSFDQPGCVMGLYSRDANILNQIPRLTDNIVFAAANRSGFACLLPSLAAFQECLHKRLS